MKLKEFTPNNCLTTRSHSSVPSLGINMKAGLFRFNHEANTLLNLKDGDHVKFHQDEEYLANWYVEKVKDKGFAVRQKETSGKGLVFNNSTLAKQIAESVEFTGKSGKCLIAGEPTKFKNRDLFGIITGTLTNK